MDSLDRIVPADGSVPLRGKAFLDWERQADEMRRALLPTLLQERAALDDAAQVVAAQPSRCPRCGSDWVYPDHGGRAGAPAGGDRPARAGRAGQEAVPVPVVWPVFFPPQDREWSLQAEAPLTPQAARRLAREALVTTHVATVQPAKAFGPVARVEA